MITSARAILQANRSRDLCRKVVDLYHELEWFVADYSDQGVAAMVTASVAAETALATQMASDKAAAIAAVTAANDPVALAAAKAMPVGDTSGVVADGSQNDGRPPVSATTLTNLKAAASQLKTALEAPITGVGLSSVSIANSIKVGN